MNLLPQGLLPLQPCESEYLRTQSQAFESLFRAVQVCAHLRQHGLPNCAGRRGQGCRQRLKAQQRQRPLNAVHQHLQWTQRVHMGTSTLQISHNIQTSVCIEAAMPDSKNEARVKDCSVPSHPSHFASLDSEGIHTSTCACASAMEPYARLTGRAVGGVANCDRLNSLDPGVRMLRGDSSFGDAAACKSCTYLQLLVSNPPTLVHVTSGQGDKPLGRLTCKVQAAHLGGCRLVSGVAGIQQRRERLALKVR